MRPTDYWLRNCYATFMHDPAGLALLDRIGARRVMWSSDYPHPESTFGYTKTTIQTILDACPADEAKAILGGTAVEVFDLDR